MFEISDERNTNRFEDRSQEYDAWDDDERKVQIQDVLDRELNPAVAMHGGYVAVLDVKGGTIYVKMMGGCQGCGMANVTLKQGVETVIQHHFPQVSEILDTTDHANGKNPYYAPSMK